jgi:hypothetical protein
MSYDPPTLAQQLAQLIDQQERIADATERIAECLARDRQEAERECTIAGMAEAAAVAHAQACTIGARADGQDKKSLAATIEHSATLGAATVTAQILTELRRRYGADDPRVLHHLKLRGLE